MKSLALVEAPDHVCCRYRIRAFEPSVLRAGGSLTIQGLEPGVVARLAQFRHASHFESVILQRKLLPGWQFAELRRRARHLVFDFDDAVLYRDSYDGRGPHCRKRAARFARTVCGVDAVIAGNDFLADCALRAGARPERVHVIPTCIATERYQLAISDPEKSGLDLVWIGSSSTVQGLERRKDLWERLAREVPSTRLRLVCDRFPDLSPMPVVAIPWSEESEAEALASGDVGISWIPDDLWSRGKCGLKILQYQAAGLPVVANPVGVHSEMIEPGASGFLATTADEWVQAVKSLADDPETRRRMGRAARASLVSGYSIEAWASTFISTITPTRRDASTSTRAEGKVDPPSPRGRRTDPRTRLPEPGTSHRLT
jgi:glycosyltransferase involved in cell wall biosynthesis